MIDDYPLHETFRVALAAGVAAIPASKDGRKRPGLLRWEQYQSQLPTPEEGLRWFGDHAEARARRYTGLGVVCGAISKNLELFEFEGRAIEAGIWGQYVQATKELGLHEVLMRVIKGWSEQSPSRGIHLLYRCEEPVDGNTELASRPATAEELAEDPEDKRKRLIETRGKGGFCVIAPSNGDTHPTGGSWVLAHGGPNHVATITAEERAALFNLARTFDQMPKDEYRPPKSEASGDGERPGDDFSERGTLAKAVEGSAWSRMALAGPNELWRRPGKHDRSWAATWHRDLRTFYVHSTSTSFPVAPKAYRLFAVLAFARFGGDFSAAARWCRQQGYGGSTTRDSRASSSEGSEKRSLLQWKRAPDPFIIPKIQWLIEGMWCQGTHGELAGGEKTLKSVLSTIIDVGLAGGVPVLGRFEVPEARPVVHLAGEGGEAGYWRRLGRVCDAYGISVDQVRPMLAATFNTAQITNPRFVADLTEKLELDQPGLVHLDPWYAYGPSNVDSRQLIEVGAALESIGGLCRQHGATVLINNHWNQTGSGHGLTRITGAGHAEWCDSWLLVRHRETPDVQGGRFWLTLDIGSRQWGGSLWDVDIELGAFDPAKGMHDGSMRWDAQPARSTSGHDPYQVAHDKNIDDAKQRLLWVARKPRFSKKPFTKTDLCRDTGGTHRINLVAFDQLAADGTFVVVRASTRRDGEGATYQLAPWATAP